MIQSIERISLVNPPILAQIRNGSKYRIVSGFKRILAAIHLNKKTIPALIHEDLGVEPQYELFLKSLYDNVSTRELNPIEKSIVITKLVVVFKISEDEIMEKFFPLLELGSNRKVLETYLRINDLEDNIKIAIVEDFISAEAAVQLLNYTHDDRQSMYELFCDLKLGKNRQKEFIRLLNDISLRDHIPIFGILHQETILTIVKNEKLTSTQKLSEVRDILRKQRFPLLISAEEKFNQIKKELKLPPRINFNPPPFFENEYYSMKIEFKDEKEFDSMLNLLNHISAGKKLSNLEKLTS